MAFEEFDEKWGKPYPAISRLWRNAWEQFMPFLDYDVEIRKVLCSTNAIESFNARYRRAVSARGHFPTEQAAMKCLYLVTRALDPKGTGQTRWTMRWKPALNAFAITFADRMPRPRTAEQPNGNCHLHRIPDRPLCAKCSAVGGGLLGGGGGVYIFRFSDGSAYVGSAKKFASRVPTSLRHQKRGTGLGVVRVRKRYLRFSETDRLKLRIAEQKAMNRLRRRGVRLRNKRNEVREDLWINRRFVHRVR